MNIKKQKAFPTIPNKNICVPIGSILAVQLFYEKLNFCDIFSKHKSKGLDLNSLLIGLLSYKLTENFRINNELIEIDYSFRTKLEELSDEEAIELLKASLINGREGFFCLKQGFDTLRCIDNIQKKGFY